MATECFKLLRFVRTRFAQLDTDKTFLAGANNLYVTDSQISLAIGLNNEAGDDFTQKNGNGDICFSFLDPDKFKNLTFALSFCDHDPQAQKLLIGGTLITDTGDTIGVAYPRVGTAGNIDGVSMEAWTYNMEGSGVDPVYPYVRHVFGQTRWTPADKTLENNPIVMAYTGVGYENSNFFDGPAQDCPFVVEDQWSSLYAYFGDTTLPDPVCGTQELVHAS
jgi:hypothetical protein